MTKLKTKTMPLRLTLDEAKAIDILAQKDMRTVAGYLRKIVCEHIGGQNGEGKDSNKKDK